MSKFRDLELKIAAGAATAADFEGFDPADVRRIKAALPYQCRGQVYRADMPMMPGMGEPDAEPDADPDELTPAQRTVTLIANVQLPDRMGDIVIANPADAAKFGGTGFEMTHFMGAGGPYLWMHDQEEGAVGRVVAYRVQQVRAVLEDGSVLSPYGLVIDVEFFADEDIPNALPAFLLTKAGLTASSIGFRPKVTVQVDDEAERAALGLGRWGSMFATSEILEVSKVMVPANPWSLSLDMANSKAIDGALRGLIARKRITPAQAAALFPTKKAAVVVPEGVAARVKAAAAAAPCDGLECLQAARAAEEPTVTFPAPGGNGSIGATAGTVCGCGAKALQTERDALAARVKALEATPAIRDADAVRRAFDAASLVVEQLSFAIDGAPEDYLEDGIDSAPPASTFDADLRIVRASASLMAALGPLVHELAGRARSGGGAPATTPAAAPPVAAEAKGADDTAARARLTIALDALRDARASLGARSP